MEANAHPTSSSDSMTFVAVLLAALAVVGALFGIGLGMRAVDESKTNAVATEGAAGPVEVKLTEFAINPKAITAGGTLHVVNNGSIPHNLRVVGTELITPDLNSGAAADLDVSTLAAGAYKVRCDIAGHEGSGMVGELTVTGEGAAAGHSPSASSMTPDQMDKAMHDRTAAFPAKTEGVGAQFMQPEIVNGVKVFNLTAKVVQWEVEPGKKVEAWTYNSVAPGPTIKVSVGDKVRLALKNDLPESTSIHIHGLKIPNGMDGVTDITQAPVKKGATFNYEFTAAEPGVGMYHSHHNAAKQVANGLFAALIVGDMPVPAGVKVAQEIPMILNDAGTIGLTINGKSFPATAPYTAKLGESFVVHYFNEGLQVHPMHLHGMPGTVIAKDGIPLASPYGADTVLVGPGERYTVLVKATEPGTWAWHCHVLTHAEREDGMFGMVTALIVQ